jgi:uncharacterized repeat protein (TIGR01451 family)
MTKRGRIGRIGVAAIAVMGLVLGGVFVGQAAYAAGDSVTITPVATTTASNTLTTYTLTLTCSTSTGCGNSTVTIPTATVTGNGSLNDFGSWFTTPRTCPAPTVTAGQASFAFPNLANGSQSCTFSLRAPNKTTLNGAQATITPTINTNGGSTPAAVPAVLTLSTASAGHNDSLGASINGATTPNVFSGAPMTLTLSFNCGVGTGDLGLSDLHISDVLPANFTYTGLAMAPIAANLQGTITTPAVGSSGGTITYNGNGHDCDNPSSNRITFTISGTAATNGVGDAVGAKICQAGATSTFTYIDGFTTTAVPAPVPCATVIDINYTSTKGVDAGTFGNSGQYKASDGTTPTRYTFPGDWDASGGDTTFNLNVSTTPAIANGGLSYSLKDPLPCLDTVSGVNYESNASGVPCAHPAYIAKKVTATGFTPAPGALIDLLFADGSTGTAAYAAGTGWTLPASPAVSEIDFRPYVEEGTNSAPLITFTLFGYVAANALPGRIVHNVAAFSAVFSGTTTAVKSPQARGTSILIADATANGRSGTVVYPSLSAAQVGATCAEQVTFNPSTNQRNRIEIAQAPSQAIYVDYLSPVGAGPFTGTTLSFTLAGTDNGHSYTASNVSPTLTPDYNGTGRTRIQWTIPAGLATVPGQYNVNVSGFTVGLPAGCAGTYKNALTLGYGAPTPTAFMQGCVSTQLSGLQQPPLNPPGDAALSANGTPIAGNYCGFSAPLTIAATKPGFTVSKSVQGDLDPAPISGGGIGKVSPAGGTATYTVTFTNSGSSNLHDPVMYDILPRVGDTEATTTSGRGSDFAVALTNVPAPPAGVTISYSTATNPCRPEVLANASNPGCVNDWSTTAPTPLSDTTALRIAYDGTVGVSGSPFTQSFSVAYAVATPATTVGNVAWNTVGTNVHTGDTGDAGATNDLLGAAESPRTGLTASSNSPAVVKGSSASTFSAVGQTLTYTFDVTNTEAVALSSVSVVDAFTDAPVGAVAPLVTCQSLTTPAGTCSGATTALQPGQTAHFSASYVVTQADIDHGALTDIATVTGQPTAGGSALVNTSNAVTVTADTSSGLTLVKSASRSTVAATTDVITYSFLVTNTGNVTLHGLSVDDPLLASIDCPAATLAPTATTTCTGEYSPSQSDLDAGSISNTATAAALDPANAAVDSTPSSVTVGVTQTAALSLVKSADRATVGQAGEVVAYEFLVTNSGNVTVTGIAIDDATLPGVVCPVADLAPTDEETCTADHTVTQAEIDSGSIVNTATATGTGPAAVAVVSDPSTVTVRVDRNPALQLTKTADITKVTASGQTIQYSFHVVNTGNVTVSAVTVQEQTFTGTGAVPTVDCSAAPTTLLPGQDLTCTASYTVSAADLKLSTIQNTAEATGLDGGAVVASASSTAAVTVAAPTVIAVILAQTGIAGLATVSSTALGLIALGLVLLVLRRRRA